MQMSKRARGSISVLLCLILLPMITYSTMIIDASRLQAVRTNISGAGDLTLNAMLSDYNYMLEEMYGLFANCSEKDDIEEALKAYFQQTIEGRFLPEVGTEGEYIQNWIGGLVDRGLDATDKIDEDALTDFLALQLNSFTADPVAGSALANPATMKRQIIEYMKYRGPVSIASTLLGKLDYLSDSHSQVDACEKKVEYTKDLGKLQDPCIATYEAIESKYNPGALLTNELLGKGITKDERDHLKEALNYSQQQFSFATAFYLMNTHSPFYKSASLEGGDYNDYGSFLRKAPQPSKSFSVNKDGAENDQTAIDARIQANLKSLDEIVQLLTNDTSSGYYDKTLHMNFEDIKANVQNRVNGSTTRSKENFDLYKASVSIDYHKSEYTDSDGKKYVYPNYQLLDDTKPDQTLSKNGNTGTSYYQPLKPFLDLNNYPGTFNINNERIKPDDAEVNKFYGLPGKSGQLDNSLAILKAQENLYKPMKNGIEYLANQHNRIRILTDQYDKIWDQMKEDVKRKYNKAVSDKKQENWNKALADAQAEWSRRWREEDDWEDRRTAWAEEREKEENKDEHGNYLLPEEEPAPESMTESEMNDLGVTVATVNETDVWNETVNGLSMPGGCANDFNGLESNYYALNEINSQLDWYEYRINLYIERLAKHNDLYFGKYGQAYTENGYSQLLAIGLILKMMYKGLEEADKQMTQIMTIVKDLDTKAEAWQKSVKNVNSDSTQAAMQSDYNTLAGQFKKEEVEKFQKLVGGLKTQVKGMWDALQGVKYFDQSLFQIDSGTTTFVSLKDKSDKAEPSIDKKIEPGKNTYEIVEKLIKEGKVLYPIADGDYFNLGIKGTSLQKCDDSAIEIVAKAGEDMWGQITDNSPTVSFLDFKDHADIFGAEFDPDITDTGNAKNIVHVAEELVSKNYSPKTHSGFDRFQILDGIKDDYGCAPTRSDKKKAEVDKLKNDPSKKDFLDPNEAFMITLYTEAKAVKQEEARKQKEEQEKNADPNHKSEEDVVSAAAKEQVDESQKEPEDNRTDLDGADIDIGEIMKEISEYKTEYNEAKDYTKRMPEPTVGDDSDDKGSLAAAQEILKAISDIATKVVDNLYLEEYFTEMFTCRTDNQMLNSLTAAKDKKVLPVVMLNGFHTESAVSSIAGDKQVLNDNTAWYGKEIEYLLWGSNDLNKNLAYTDAMIFAIRFALNAIYAFTAPDIQSYALELATAIAGWTVVGVPIVQVCITILIALAESGYDLYLLHDGREVPIYKNQATFVCSPTGMLKKIATEVAVQVAEEVITSAVESVEDHLDAKIDELEAKTKDWANAKISDCKDSLNSVTEEYVKRQTEAVKEEIRKQFITPVLNKVIPLGSLAEISQMYSELKVEELVDNALNDKDNGAFAIIEKNITDMAPGVVQEILQKLIDKDAEPFTVSVPNPLNPTEMTEYTVDCAKYYSELKESITSTITTYLTDNLETENIMSFDLESKLDQAVDKLFEEEGGQSILALVQEKVNAAAGTITKAIDENLDKGAETAKSFMREKMDAATEQITGKMKESVTAHLDGLPEGKEIDTDASSGITLNYKEYCKIFMLLFVSFNQNQILQRAAVLITCNMRHVTPIVDDCGDIVVNRIEKYNLSDFTMTKANTMFSVSAKVNMMTLFPWPVSDNMDETSTDAGLKFDPMSIKQTGVIINYCGINGY